MGKDEKIKETQEVLDWVMTHLNLGITCKVIDYKRGNYRVQVLKRDRIILPIEVTEEWVKENNPKENVISERLKTILKTLETYPIKD